MPQETISKKRSSEDDVTDEVSKRRAVGDVTPVSQTRLLVVQWSTQFGVTCLFGTVGTSHSDGRVALFDLDQTLINTKTGYRFPQDQDDWRWFSPKVPAKLKQLHSEGYTIFIISNQTCPRKVTKPEQYYAQWKNKVALVAHELQGVPFRILAATAQDAYRKPLPGMWQAITDILKEQGVTVDQEKAFFVGDAAGRKRDHSACDRKFAVNVGIQFHTPEEYFLGEAPTPFHLTGLHPSTIRDRPYYLPTQYPLVPDKKKGKLTMVLFVGYPAMGKTMTYKKYFEPAGYVYVDYEALETKSNCMTAIEKAVKAGQNVVVDNTNHDVTTRKDFIDHGAGLNMDVRCIVFDGGIELAWHNYVYQTFIKTGSLSIAEKSPKPLEYAAFQAFKRSYHPATDVEFKHRVLTVYWRFQGSEEERRRYTMWLDF